VIQGPTKHLKDWENKGWIGVKNATLFCKAVIRPASYLMRQQSAPTFLEWVKGHNSKTRNKESDKLAKEGMEKTAPDDLPLDILPDYDLQGAKLATMTQALAYNGIHKRNPTPPHRQTMKNLELMKATIRHFTLSHKTDEAIWKGMRRNSMHLCVQQFPFKAMHKTYKIENYWSNIPGYQT
ncbi:hypothetical protein EI94DRAFT_1582633, partial [Lactarius quietus]